MKCLLKYSWGYTCTSWGGAHVGPFKLKLTKSLRARVTSCHLRMFASPNFWRIFSTKSGIFHNLIKTSLVGRALRKQKEKHEKIAQQVKPISARISSYLQLRSEVEIPRSLINCTIIKSLALVYHPAGVSLLLTRFEKQFLFVYQLRHRKIKRWITTLVGDARENYAN